MSVIRNTHETPITLEPIVDFFTQYVDFFAAPTVDKENFKTLLKNRNFKKLNEEFNLILEQAVNDNMTEMNPALARYKFIQELGELYQETVTKYLTIGRQEPFKALLQAHPRLFHFLKTNYTEIQYYADEWNALVKQKNIEFLKKNIEDLPKKVGEHQDYFQSEADKERFIERVKIAIEKLDTIQNTTIYKRIVTNFIVEEFALLKLEKLIVKNLENYLLSPEQKAKGYKKPHQELASQIEKLNLASAESNYKQKIENILKQIPEKIGEYYCFELCKKKAKKTSKVGKNSIFKSAEKFSKACSNETNRRIRQERRK